MYGSKDEEKARKQIGEKNGSRLQSTMPITEAAQMGKGERKASEKQKQGIANGTGSSVTAVTSRAAELASGSSKII